jgi:SPP1 family predicted phage head-tail adaptor
MINAGDYKHKILIYQEIETEDDAGFKIRSQSIILSARAKVKTTKGFTLLKNNTDFEQAHTNFTIRFPKKEITRDMLIEFKGKTYTIEYLYNVDELNVELEIQARVVVK